MASSDSLDRTSSFCSNPDCFNDSEDNFSASNIFSEHEDYEILTCNFCQSERDPLSSDEKTIELVKRLSLWDDPTEYNQHGSSTHITPQCESLCENIDKTIPHSKSAPSFSERTSSHLERTITHSERIASLSQSNTPQLDWNISQPQLETIEQTSVHNDFVLPQVENPRHPILFHEHYSSHCNPDIIGEFNLDSVNDVISFAPCQVCGSTKGAIKGNNNETIAWYCKKCHDCSGVDDTFSVDEAITLVNILAYSLEHATLKLEPCDGCGNDDPDLFIFDQENEQTIIKCQLCGVKYGENKERQTEYPLMECDCGNTDYELFQVTTDDNGDICRVICLCCCNDEMVQSASEIAENKSSTEGKDTFASNKSTCKKCTSTFTSPYGRTRVHDVFKLKPADHVYWERPYAVSHHAIVEKLDKDGTMHVIHYSGPAPDRKLKAGVFREKQTKTEAVKDPLFRMEYKECKPVGEVLEYAVSRIGEHLYNPFTNNCEHFAEWCKTGIAKSGQVKSFMEWLATKPADFVAMMARDGIKMGRYMAADTAETVVRAGKGIARTALRTFGKAEVITGGLVVGFEVIRTGVDIYRSYKDMKKGNIDKKEFARVTVNRVIQGVGGAAGSIAGGFIGSFIPIPILGTLIGGTVGGFLGEIFGRIIGRQVAKKM